MPQIARCLLPTNKRLLDENVPPKSDEAESLLQHGATFIGFEVFLKRSAREVGQP